MTMAPPPEGMTPPPKEHQTRTSPEVRAEILAMFKRASPKYARPFEKGDRLSRTSILGYRGLGQLWPGHSSNGNPGHAVVRRGEAGRDSRISDLWDYLRPRPGWLVSPPIEPA